MKMSRESYQVPETMGTEITFFPSEVCGFHLTKLARTYHVFMDYRYSCFYYLERSTGVSELEYRLSTKSLNQISIDTNLNIKQVIVNSPTNCSAEHSQQVKLYDVHAPKTVYVHFCIQPYAPYCYSAISR